MNFQFLAAIFCLSLIQGCGTTPVHSPRDKIAIGAIRWDAWCAGDGTVCNSLQRTLGAKKWHDRLPFFAKVTSENSVEFPGYSAEILDKEINFARQAGIDYWAFVLYGESDLSTDALRAYLASEKKSEVRFSVIIGPWLLMNRDDRSRLLARLKDLTGNSAYQRVDGKRPLVFLYDNDGELELQPWSKTYFNRMRDELTHALGERPYLVLMSASPHSALKFADSIEADALTAYQVHENKKAAPYAELVSYTERFWETCKATGKSVVPIVMTGWDRRPRVEHPVPWEVDQKVGIGSDQYYLDGSTREIANHFSSAARWVSIHPAETPAKTILVYAWNEYDEGGWLTPSIGSDDRLQAAKIGIGVESPHNK